MDRYGLWKNCGSGSGLCDLDISARDPLRIKRNECLTLPALSWSLSLILTCGTGIACGGNFLLPPYFPSALPYQEPQIYVYNLNQGHIIAMKNHQNVFLLYFQSDYWLSTVLRRNSRTATGNYRACIMQQNCAKYFTWIITANP